MMKKLMMRLLVLVVCMFPCNNTFAGINVDKIFRDIITKQDVSVLASHVAPTKTIKTDGTYYAGKITYINDNERKDRVPYHYFKFTLQQPTNLKLHFISHVDDRVDIELRDSDENIIRPFEANVYFDSSPFTKTVTLNKGEYTFTIFKIRSRSRCSNTGDYKFKFESVEIE